MLLACVQTDVKFADVNFNLQRVLKWIDEAKNRNADLVVFPECVLTGYAFDSRKEALDIAIRTNSDTISDIVSATKSHDLHVTLGFLERDGDRLYNSAALVGPSGLVGIYRKVHLPTLGVDRFVDRGDIPYQTLRAGDANVGLAICYDCSFPEPMRVLGLAGADIVALGTNWPVAASRTADIVPPARSMENHYFFAAANRVGTERGFRFCGRSSICGPDGIVLAQTLSDEEILLTAEINLNHARNKTIERTQGAHLIDRMKDRRPEFYGPIAETK